MNNTEWMETATDQQLRQGLAEWADQGRLRPEQSGRLAGMVRRMERRERWRRRLAWGTPAAAAAAAMVLILNLSPEVRAWAGAHLGPVGEYINRWSHWEKGWVRAEQNGLYQEVLAGNQFGGYTFRVHKVLADATQTTIFYTVEGENLDQVRLRLDPEQVRFNGREFVRHWHGRDEIIDGVLVGSLVFDPLPEPAGTMHLLVYQLGPHMGWWGVSFPVVREVNGGFSRALPVGQELTVGAGTLTVERLVLAPTQTVVEFRYRGPVPAGAPSGQKGAPEPSGSLLLRPDGTPLAWARGGSGEGLTANGVTEQSYRVYFDPLEPAPSELILEAAQQVSRDDDTQVPLEPGATVAGADGRTITLTALAGDGRTGEAVLTFPADRRLDHRQDAVWTVVDDQGRRHRPESTVIAAPDGATLQLTLRWSLPEGRTAAFLLRPYYWERVIYGQFHIQIPQDIPQQ